jgi:hypothetical protein
MEENIGSKMTHSSCRSQLNSSTYQMEVGTSCDLLQLQVQLLACSITWMVVFLFASCQQVVDNISMSLQGFTRLIVQFLPRF